VEIRAAASPAEPDAAAVQAVVSGSRWQIAMANAAARVVAAVMPAAAARAKT
jgi:hypothetical protein